MSQKFSSTCILKCWPGNHDSLNVCKVIFYFGSSVSKAMCHENFLSAKVLKINHVAKDCDFFDRSNQLDENRSVQHL